MKKYICFLLLGTVVLGMTIISANADPPSRHEDGMFAAAMIPSENFDAFYEFVETGEPDIYDISTLCLTHELIYTNDGRETIKMTRHPEGGGYTFEKGDSGGTWNFGYHLFAGVLDFDTFKYYLYIDNMEKLLAKNGIACSVNDYMIVSLSRYLPPFIWVDTDQGDYYIMLASVDSGQSEGNNYTYEVYDTTAMLKTKAIILEKSKTPPIEIYVDNSIVISETPAITKSGRILVPVRALCEKMKATVDWAEDTQSVTVTLGNTSIKFTVGDKTAWVNGEKYELDVSPEIMNNRTLVPLRFIGENFGYRVVWMTEELVKLYSNYVNDPAFD